MRSFFFLKYLNVADFFILMTYVNFYFLKTNYTATHKRDHEEMYCKILYKRQSVIIAFLILLIYVNA